MKSSTWRCQKSSLGAKCGHDNPKRAKKCQRCGKLRARKKPKPHMWALKLSYEDYILLNGGEHCGVCGRGPKSRKLDRDHEHGDLGVPRGLLCAICNQRIWNDITLDWAKALVKYLERAEGYRQRLEGD